jgi:hypothetical protein
MVRGRGSGWSLHTGTTSALLMLNSMKREYFISYVITESLAMSDFNEDETTLRLLSLRGEEDSPSNILVTPVQNLRAADEDVEHYYGALFQKIYNIKKNLEETISQLRDLCNVNNIFSKQEFMCDKKVLSAVTREFFDIFQRAALLSKEHKSTFDQNAVARILLVFIIIIAIFNIIVIFVTIVIFRSSFFI